MAAAAPGTRFAGHFADPRWMAVPHPQDAEPPSESASRRAVRGDPPHAMRHRTLAYLLGAHVAQGDAAAVDMLTRTDRTSDFAPDTSVFPIGLDRATGGRRLEVLAFEIVSKKRLSVAQRKAKQLVARGVERVFAWVLRSERALEWDRRTGAAQTVEALCRALAVPLDRARRAQILAACLPELRALAKAIETGRRWPTPARVSGTGRGSGARTRRSTPKTNAR